MSVRGTSGCMGRDEDAVLITRLVTFVDIHAADDSQLSFSARHDVLLADGRRIVLLNDRGWSQSRIYFFGDGEPTTRNEGSSPWEGVTREHIEEAARTVVGPDEAYGDYTQSEIDEAHWAYLSGTLGKHGIDVDATDLRGLPHEVELSDRLLARIGDPIT
jgi:hypothetical protein